MTSTLTNLESVELRNTISQFYENMHPQNIIDLDVTDNYRFTLPPFLYINENNNLTFIPNLYQQNTIQLSSTDLINLMGYISTLIRLLQIRYSHN